MFAIRSVLRLKGLSDNPLGGRRASHACTNSAILLFLVWAHDLCEVLDP